MILLQRFLHYIRQQRLLQPAGELLLAVSGGVDSVVLCELCHQAGCLFSIAHANFQLRGKESEEDEQFVRNLADRYQVPVHVKLFDTEKYATLKKVSIQVAARELRYQWFHELLAAGHSRLLTAHHADDNIETMVMNFFRGTGISGLRGILPASGRTIRPLLLFTKEELSRFAVENQLQWREDSSNQTDKYSRNYFRNTILPAVTKVFPEAEHNLMENAQRFREIESLYGQSIALHRKRLLEKKGNEIHVPVLKLKKTEPLRTVLYEIIKDYGFSARQLTDVLQLLDGEHGKFVRSGTHRIIRNRNWLIIAAIEQQQAGYVVIEEAQDEAVNGALKLQSLTNNDPPPADHFVAYLDAGEVEYPLIWRKWKPGDYFYPLGMTKKKKVARFLIDQKISPTEKEKVMVLESGKRICWLAGLRIDERFKLRPQTRSVLRVTFCPQLLK